TICGAYYLIHNGYLDQKKSELEAKRSEIAIQNTKLEMDQMALIAKRDSLGGQIVEYTKQLQDREKAFQNVTGQLALAERRITEVEAKYDMYLKHEKALGTFAKVSAATKELPKSKRG